MAFKTFRHKSNGVVADYPEDYATHPVFGFDLEPYDIGDDEYEEDKVVYDHTLPVDQRATIVATKLEELTVAELKEILSEKGLPTSGNKEELIARIHDSKEEN